VVEEDPTFPTRDWVQVVADGQQEKAYRANPTQRDIDRIRAFSLSISQPHWEYAERLEELRLEAQDKADALNRRLAG
jgi:hypothetical protein